MGATKKTLVVGMDDFGAPHIVDAGKKLLSGRKGQDSAKGTEAKDFADQETIDALTKALKAKFESTLRNIHSAATDSQMVRDNQYRVQGAAHPTASAPAFETGLR